MDSTPNNSSTRYPAYLVMQNFETYDGNLRLTLRPRRNVTLVSRYEFQYSTIHTTPDPISGLSEVESSTMTSHIIAQDVSWTPWSRLYLQAGFNYVLSETKTPAVGCHPGHPRRAEQLLDPELLFRTGPGQQDRPEGGVLLLPGG